MTQAVKTEEPEQSSNVIEFKKPLLQTGSKPPETTYWLKDLPEAYVFLVREKPQGGITKFGALMLQILRHTEVCTLLYDLGSNNRFWVHTNDFSRFHQCLEVFPVEMPKENTEDANGTSDRTD